MIFLVVLWWVLLVICFRWVFLVVCLIVMGDVMVVVVVGDGGLGVEEVDVMEVLRVLEKVLLLVGL